MYAALDLLPKVVDDLTDAAYDFVLERNYREDLGSSPHGEPWHTSFHASQFPIDKDFACPRKAVYRLANFAEPERPSRWLVGLGEVGKGIEVALVDKWHQFGVLISPPPTEPIQLGAVDEDAWLTCSFDSVLLPFGWNRPLPVEVKSKALEKVREMILGDRGPDEQHIAQIKVQLYFLSKMQSEWWPDLEPVTHGVIYYLARDDPKVTKEFTVPLDVKWVEDRIEILGDWKDNFLREEIAQTQEKKHPLGWKWSELPCKWCPFKKDICKPDWQEGITNLSESSGIKRTKEARAGYDYSATRRATIERWGTGGSGSSEIT